MKSICFFIATISNTGGTERVCTEIANKLVSLGYTISILSMYGNNPFFKLDPAITVKQVYKQKYPFKMFLPVVVLNLRSKLKEINPDIVVSVDAAIFIYAGIAFRGLHLKNIVWEHFNFNSSLNSRVRVIARKLAAKHSDAVVTLTDEDAVNWRINLKCLAPVYAINNPSPFIAISQGSLTENKIVLSVGRLTHQKGFDRLIEVWAKVMEYGQEGWQLNIVGSGEMENLLRDKILTLNLSTSIQIIPATPNIQQHYRNAAIYCMASRFEGFPMVLLEAQSFGLPLISYDCETGPSEIIKDNMNGLLIKDGNSQGMAKALIRLMTTRQTRVKMAEYSLKNASKYTIDVIIEQWLTLFDKLEKKLNTI